jgi:murein DD-endopeptidase MepM/ murein hydrolase activator NlpD
VAALFNLAVFAAGSEIAIHGFVFPVGDPHSFGDSFGAPRMMGTGYEHAHQGIDIMAPTGTPLLACERGIVTKMGSDVLGGTKIWVKGQSGTYYYYAHLSAFADGMVDGLVVEPGTIIGYVGDTGNAKGGAPHLHFEIHPEGGPAVNPYPLLKVVDDLSRRAKANQG